MAREHFSKVKAAREAFRDKAQDLLDQYQKAITAALAAGEYEAAIKALQWGLEHAPADEDGVRVMDQSIDKPKIESKPTGPQISIGFALGGLTNANQPKALPEAIIDL